MNKSNELAKEERTIFIVLAIIIMIAIGVLVTWYFTKDKKEEEKDTDKPTKIVDKQPKKEVKDDTASYVLTTKEPVKVATLNTTVAKKPVEDVEYINYTEDDIFYVVGEYVNYSEAGLYTYKNGNIKYVKLSGATISKVKYYNEDTNKWVSADGRYTITNGKIRFDKEGTYIVILKNSDSEEYELYAYIYSENSFNEYVANILSSAKNVLASNEYDPTLTNKLAVEIQKFNEVNNNITEKRRAFQKLLDAYYEAVYSVNPKIALEDLINSDEILNLVETDYTLESYQALQALLEKATEILDGTQVATSTEIKNITTEIENAIANLVTYEEELKTLKDLVVNVENEYNGRDDEFTTETFTELTIAINNAKSLNNNDLENATKENLVGVSVSDITSYINAIKEAKANLVDKTVAITALNAELEKAKVYVEADYTAETFANLTAAIEAINNTDLETATLTDILTLKNNLTTAVEGLVEKEPIVEENPEKIAAVGTLQSLIAQHENSEVESIVTVISNAKTLDLETATVEEINALITAINEAVNQSLVGAEEGLANV